MFGMGIGELAVIAFILLVFFGPKKLPELAKGIGQAINEFKKSGREELAKIDNQKNNNN